MKRVYQIIDLHDALLGLVDPDDMVISVDSSLEALADYALEELHADRVTYLGETVAESHRSRRADSRFER